jgi:ATP sulfurylase
LAYLDVEEIYKPDKHAEGDYVYGGDKDHPEIININKCIKD